MALEPPKGPFKKKKEILMPQISQDRGSYKVATGNLAIGYDWAPCPLFISGQYFFSTWGSGGEGKGAGWFQSNCQLREC